MVITSNLILLKKKQMKLIFPFSHDMETLKKEIDKISKFLVNRTN